ncbi:ABC transporter permease [Candidatus Bipolaricaulota sp. J31]
MTGRAEHRAGFVAGRILQHLAALLVIVTLNFLLPRLMPGSPLRWLAGEDVSLLSPEARAEIVSAHGLDRPLAEQYVRYLGRLLRGDLGYSYRQKRPVSRIIGERLGWTALLVGTGLLLSTALGLLLGAIAAWKRGGLWDIASLSACVWLGSMPSFWLGMILMALLSAHLGWFPAFGARSPWLEGGFLRRALDVAWHMVLPVTTLTLIMLPRSFLLVRYSLAEVLGEDFIAVARAKGLGEGTVVLRHALRNALLPITTDFMLRLGFIAGGAVVVETVFAWPGLGRLMYEAVLARDYPVLQAAFLAVAVGVILGNVLADAVYPFLDPRVRHG